jgi:hypothetical protein
MTIFYFIIVYHYFYKNVGWRYLIVILFLSPIIIVTIGLIRNIGKEGFEFGTELFLWQLVYRADYLSGYTKLIEYLDLGKLSYRFGITFWDFFSSFFPRVLIPGKPSSVEVHLTKELFGGGSTWVMAFGGIGEMFYNFSYAGVFCWFTIVGYSLGKLNELFLISIKNGNIILFSMVLSLPFFLNGWNMGINCSPTRAFIISYMFILANIFVLYFIQKSILLVTNSSE